MRYKNLPIQRFLYEAGDAVDRGKRIPNVIKMLKILSEDERYIITMRYGLYDGYYGRVYTLESLGKLCGVSKQRIHQIEKRALMTLSNSPIYLNKVKEFNCD